MSNENIDITEDIFLDILNKSRCKRVKIACYKILYIFGDEGALDQIIEELNGHRYRNRCFAVNVLIEISSRQNRAKILIKLRERRNKEKSIAVQSTIDRAIETLESIDV